MDKAKDDWSVDRQITKNHQVGAALPANKITWNILIAGVAVVLVVVTFMQLLEVSRLKGYVEAAQINGGATQTVKPATAANPPPPAGGLPSQVGGC